MAVTSAEVARVAGVSQATVSYVLNDTPGQTISTKTRDRVLAAAHDLGYRPNAAARSLRTGRGAAVLLPLPGPAGHVLAQLTEACSDALVAHDLTLVTDPAVYGSVEEQLDAWLRVRPAAVLDLLLPHDDPVLPALREAGVVVLSPSGGEEPSWESAGDAFAIEARKTQLSYLLERGHRRIAFVRPARMHADGRVARNLLQQLRRMAAAAGAELDVVQCDLTSGAIRTLVAGWRRKKAAPDAVCAINDEYAIALVSALVDTGLRVPDDIAVIGVDDIPFASYVTPSLTTVAADFTALANGIATAVMQLLEDPAAQNALPRPEHHLVVRESA
jgi:DNA-binding LacI/PurR family transcriptional regulator